jgi:PAS domain S-box-containing protein
MGEDGGAVPGERIAEAQAMDLERLYRQIIEGSPDAIVLGDAKGVIRLWNAGARAMFGFTAEEAVGQSMDIIIPERLRGRHWDGYHKVMATGISRYGSGDLLAVPAITKDGRTISIEFTIQMLKGPAGEILGPVATIRDVTKRFQREKEMARRLKELEAKGQG